MVDFDRLVGILFLMFRLCIYLISIAGVSARGFSKFEHAHARAHDVNIFLSMLVLMLMVSTFF